jgi:hypothetical protein
MTTQTWEAHIRPSIIGVRRIAAEQQQAEAWLTPDEIPAEVRAFLDLGAGNIIAADEAPNIAALQTLVARQPDLVQMTQPDPSRLDWRLSFDVVPPPEPNPLPEPLVDFDFDIATYVGDGQDGCYYQTGEGPGGWYVTVVVDSDTGHFVMDMVTASGPYDTEGHAEQVGRDLATTWCIDNRVGYGEDDDDE